MRSIGLRLALLVAAAAALLLSACSRPDPDVLSGYAEADLVYLAPATAGRLERLQVQRGARVAAGDALFALEADQQQLAIEAARQRSESAAAQVANLSKGKRVDELRAIEQQLAQARAALALSTAEDTRTQNLVTQGFESPQRLDTARAARERDEARVRELQSQLAVARSAARPDEIAAAAAEQRALAADAAQARWLKDQRQRVAPAPGVVYDVLYRPGEWVPAGAPVVALLPDGAVKLRGFVPQARLAQVALGQRLAVGCDGCPSGLVARITFISPQAEYTPPVIYSNESRSKLVFLIEARPEGAAAAQLKPGQPVQLRVLDK
jgi:HlyD family secretion protein